MRSYRNSAARNEARAGLKLITVRARPGRPTQGILQAGRETFACALGRGGVTARKREGDGGTPLARMRILSGYFRGDQVRPGGTRLPLKPISEELGWCEVPGDRNYNRPVRMPYAASHETMRRADRLYDYCLVLDWNVSPRRRGVGSAIFFHLARSGYSPTQGCVGVSLRTMQRLLPHLTDRTVLWVRR